MNWIANILLIFFISVGLLISESTFSETEEDVTSHLEQLRQKFKDGYIFEAEMMHEFTDSFTGEVTRASGTIIIGTDRYKIITDGQQISVDGSNSTVFNEAQNKVIISNYFPEDDDFAPSRFLGQSDSGFLVRDVITGENGHITFKLGSDDIFEIITEAKVIIEADSLIPVEISAVDQSDNNYFTIFKEGAFVPFDEALFALSWPSGTDIIDLREE